MNSIWTETASPPQFPALKQDTKTDVLVIGGGITGILCAYMLQRAGVDYILVEAARICDGITKNTTAKITLQHGLIYDKLIRTFGPDHAGLYAKANMEALEQYREICKTIDCDFEKRDSFVYTLDQPTKIEKEVAALKKLGVFAEYVSKLDLPFPIAGAVRVGDQAQFHPLKFLYGIAKELHIFENTRVLELKPGQAITNHGKITAGKMIVATHFPIVNKHGSYFLKLYQHRSYVLAIDNADRIQGMYVDEAKKGMSFREYGELLLIGGGSHRTGKKGGNWQELRSFVRKYYPRAKERYYWATQDCMSLDHVPYIGHYSSRMQDLYTASGFNKWGMSSAMVAAMVLTDMVQGKENVYAPVFSPSRNILRPQLAINAVESLGGLLTPTVPRCPHMGCALKYNRAEHSWDCSCHGSRFTEKGELIDNPATDDKRGI